MTEPKQWAIEQHIKKNPKCEWLCTHTNQHNLGEVLEDTTEPTREDRLEVIMKLINDYASGWDVGCPEPSEDDIQQAIQALISDQVAKARIDELIGVRGWTEYEPDPKYSPAERFHIVPYTYLTNRIAELKGVKNK